MQPGKKRGGKPKITTASTDTDVTVRRPLKELAQGVKQAVRHVREEHQQQQEDRIQGEVDKRVSAERRTDAVLAGVAASLENIARAQEDERRLKEQQHLHEEKQKLALEANKLQLDKANQRFAEEKYSVAYDEYKKVTPGLIISAEDLSAKVQSCYNQMVIQAKALIVAADGLIATPSIESLADAKTKLKTAEHLLRKIKHTEENESFDAVKSRFEHAKGRLSWQNRRVELNPAANKLLDATYNKNQYQKLLKNLHKYQEIYGEIAQEFLDDSDREIINKLAIAITKYKDLEGKYQAELMLEEQGKRNASLSRNIKEDLKAYNEALEQHKLPLALAKLLRAQADAAVLVVAAGGISDQRYIDPKYFAALVADLEPRVGAFNESMAVAPDIADAILLAAIQKYNPTYAVKDLFSEHATSILNMLTVTIKQQWHKFDNIEFPESLRTSLIRLIHSDIKDIGWGKWWHDLEWGDLLRRAKAKKISINFIDGNPELGTNGLLVKIKDSITGYLVPIPTAQVAQEEQRLPLVDTATPPPFAAAFNHIKASAPQLQRDRNTSSDCSDEEYNAKFGKESSPPYRGERPRLGSKKSSAGSGES